MQGAAPSDPEVPNHAHMSEEEVTVSMSAHTVGRLDVNGIAQRVW